MDESGGSESELVGSGNSSSQAKDEMLLNIIQLLPEGQRYAAFTKYLEEQTKQENERTNQREETKRIQEKEREETKRIQLLRVGERAAAVAEHERTKRMHLQV
jgi:hypothetical protein